MEKLSAAQLNGILIEAADSIEKLAAENAELRKLLADQATKDHAVKIAHTAVDRGIISPDDADNYAQDLLRRGADLTSVEELINRSAPAAPLGQFKEASAASYSDNYDAAEQAFIDAISS